MCRNLSILLLAWTTISQSFGQRQDFEQPIQQFFISKIVFPQEKGEWEITIIPALRKSDVAKDLELGWKVEYGASDKLELELEMSYLWLNPAGLSHPRGLGNVELGVLYNFVPLDRPVGVSVSSEVELPAGGKNVTDDEVEWETLLILAKSFGRAQVHFNVGVGLAEDHHKFIYNVASVIPLDQSFALTLEVNGIELIEEHEPYLTPGLYFRAFDEEPLFELGVGFPIALSGDSTPWGIIGKLTLEF